MARSLNSQMVFEYIQERLRTAYKYFACPQSRNGTNSSRGYLRKKNRRRARVPRHVRRGTDASTSRDVKNAGEEEDEESSDDDDEEEDEDDTLRAGFRKLLANDVQTDAGLPDEAASQELSATIMSSSAQNGLMMESDEEEEKEQQLKVESVAPEDMHYIFDRMIFTGGKVTTADNITIILPFGFCFVMKEIDILCMSKGCTLFIFW